MEQKVNARTKRAVQFNGGSARPTESSPWTDAFAMHAQSNGHDTHGSQPAPRDADMLAQDALMQCYNG